MTGGPGRRPGQGWSEALRFNRTAILLVSAILVAVPAMAGTPSPSYPLLDPEPSVAAPKRSATLHPDRQMELLARKIGQMILVGFPGTRPAEPWPTRIAAMIADGRIGGVILFGHNIRGPKQVSGLTEAMIAAGGRLPPFVAVDQEGGYIQRFRRREGFKGLPSSARTIAKQGLCEAWVAYANMARELATFGVNVNLGPVVDLNINPQSPAIGRLRRSYGIEPGAVTDYARQFIGAHAASGVLTAAKHFPGHGSAALDPHKRVVDITRTWQPQELEVFRALARDDGVAMVMVGHLIHPGFSDGDRPTSLSRRAMTGELRERLGFDGLIVTDDLGMEAITDRYGLEDAAVMAVRAGADILIFANQRAGDNDLVERVIARVSGAVAAGRVPASQLDRSYERILAVKRRLAARGPLPPLPDDGGLTPDICSDAPGRSITSNCPLISPGAAHVRQAACGTVEQEAPARLAAP